MKKYFNVIARSKKDKKNAKEIEKIFNWYFHKNKERLMLEALNWFIDKELENAKKE